MKKAQIQGQVFIYILTLIITAGILLYGYNAIKVINENANQVELVNFKDALKQDFEKMSSDYGSSKTETYNVPSKIKKICFYQTGEEPLFRAMPRDLNPLIIDSIKDETGNNVFLVFNDGGFDQMNFGRIEISNEDYNMICIEPSGNRLKLRLEGLGDGVLVERG
ncbi:MAG: hypothetical protein KKF74_00875 [Nanoarchaeota archaeon]|nr:hypothetical protein [Nanoarchaeota archaeon]